MDLASTLAGTLAVVVIAWLLLVALVWLNRPSRALAGAAIRVIPDLVRLVRDLLADRTTPTIVRVVLGALLVYLVIPIDVVPDFVPGIGAADDLVIAALVLRWAGRRVGIHGLRAHWKGDAAGFDVLLTLLGLR